MKTFKLISLSICYLILGVSIILGFYACNPTPTEPPIIAPPPVEEPTEPDPIPPPITQPPPNSTEPKFYIQWDRRVEWAKKLEFAYSEWRGHRDLDAILTNGRQYLKGGAKAILAINAAQLQEIINRQAALQAESRTLQHKIITIKHKNYEDRSQVRKSVANTMQARLIIATAEYTEIASKFPPSAVCDSIKCKLISMNNQ